MEVLSFDAPRSGMCHSRRNSQDKDFCAHVSIRFNSAAPVSVRQMHSHMARYSLLPNTCIYRPGPPSSLPHFSCKPVPDCSLATPCLAPLVAASVDTDSEASTHSISSPDTSPALRISRSQLVRLIPAPAHCDEHCRVSHALTTLCWPALHLVHRDRCRTLRTWASVGYEMGAWYTHRMITMQNYQNCGRRQFDLCQFYLVA